MSVYILAAEYISMDHSKGEVLVFQRGHKAAALPPATNKPHAGDEESGTLAPGDEKAAVQGTDDDGSRRPAQIQKQQSIFHWKDVCYDIKIKGQPRRILDHVDGWVKPGTLTALMVRQCLRLFFPLMMCTDQLMSREPPELGKPPFSTSSPTVSRWASSRAKSLSTGTPEIIRSSGKRATCSSRTSTSRRPRSGRPSGSARRCDSPRRCPCRTSTTTSRRSSSCSRWDVARMPLLVSPARVRWVLSFPFLRDPGLTFG